MGILALRTSSLLWALEKEGYGRLVLESRNEAVPDRLAASRPGIEDLRGGALCEVDSDVEEERAVGAVDSGSLVDEREEVLGCCCCCCCCCLLPLEMEEEEEVVFDFLFLVLLGLTGKNMAGS